MCDVFVYANPTLAPLSPSPSYFSPPSIAGKKRQNNNKQASWFLLFLVVGVVVVVSVQSALG